MKGGVILLTGADGFLGSHLTDFVLEKGYRVIALKSPEGPIKNLSHYTNGKKLFREEEKEMQFGSAIKIPSVRNDISIIECDIRDADLVEKIITEFRPFMIFHFAAQPFVIPSWEDPAGTIRTNVIGTINIFEPIKKHNIKCKVISACSSAEYGTTTEKVNRPLREDDPVKALHPYGISKIATELIARQYWINFEIQAVNLRYFNQTGPRKTNDACSDFVRKVAQIDLGLTEPHIEVGNLEPFRDITGARDSIKATWLAAIEGKVGEVYNVCSGRKVKIRDVLNTALSFSKKEITVKENTPAKLRETDEDVILGDNTKLKRDTGFEITQSIEDLLREMYDYWIGYYTQEKKK